MICINIIVDFLNIVLYTGLVSTEWCLGIINPIYKNKGPRSDPDNYRGIHITKLYMQTIYGLY